MKFLTPILSLVILLGACSSSKKGTPATKPSSPTVTKKDVFRGGTSLENPVVIKVETEKAGLDEEYKWLTENHPGYTTIRKAQISRGNKHYDIIRIRTRDGHEKDIYFDTTSFFGKW